MGLKTHVSPGPGGGWAGFWAFCRHGHLRMDLVLGHTVCDFFPRVDSWGVLLLGCPAPGVPCFWVLTVDTALVLCVAEGAVQPISLTLHRHPQSPVLHT